MTANAKTIAAAPMTSAFGFFLSRINRLTSSAGIASTNTVRLPDWTSPNTRTSAHSTRLTLIFSSFRMRISIPSSMKQAKVFGYWKKPASLSREVNRL